MDKITEKESSTIAHYDKHAKDFWLGTKDHDVSQNIHAFLAALPKNKALDILDLGCGPGRDLLQFKSLGHRPTGLDGSATFCKMAADYSGCPTINQNFTQIQLADNQFDGVFANACLFHVPSNELLNVLKKLHACLREGGVLFSSNPRGNTEGWQGERYGHYIELEASQRFLEQAGFELLDHYYRPAGKSREQQPWLALVSKKSTTTKRET